MPVVQKWKLIEFYRISFSTYHRENWLRGQNPFGKKSNFKWYQTNLKKLLYRPKNLQNQLKYVDNSQIFQIKNTKNSRKIYEISQTSHGRPGRTFF